MTTADDTREKPYLILLAGLLCDRSIWADVAARLAAVARIEIIDFPNFASLESMAEHVIAASPERFVLVGHSMGARVAIEVVRRVPHRVRALGLFNTGVHPVSEQEPASRQALVRLAHESGMRRVAEQWLPPMLNEHGEVAAALRERLMQMVERASPTSFANQISALLNRPDAEAVLPSIRIPTLLMSATGDRWSPVAQHAAMRQHIPHADLAVIDDAGHMAPVEQPEAVADAMRAWLVSLGSEALDALQRLQIEAQCTRQIHRYARLNDAAAFDELAKLYTEDGVFARPTEPNVHIRGRAAILASLQGRPPRITRHVMSGIEVDVQSTTRARAHSTVTLYLGEGTTVPAPIKSTLVGTFDDVLQKVGDEWLFVQRLGALHLKT